MPYRRHRTWHTILVQYTDTGPTCRCAIHWCGTSHWNTQLPVLMSWVRTDREILPRPSTHTSECSTWCCYGGQQSETQTNKQNLHFTLIGSESWIHSFKIVLMRHSRYRAIARDKTIEINRDFQTGFPFVSSVNARSRTWRRSARSSLKRPMRMCW